MTRSLVLLLVVQHIALPAQHLHKTNPQDSHCAVNMLVQLLLGMSAHCSASSALAKAAHTTLTLVAATLALLLV